VEGFCGSLGRPRPGRRAPGQAGRGGRSPLLPLANEGRTAAGAALGRGLRSGRACSDPAPPTPHAGRLRARSRARGRPARGAKAPGAPQPREDSGAQPRSRPQLKSLMDAVQGTRKASHSHTCRRRRRTPRPVRCTPPASDSLCPARAARRGGAGRGGFGDAAGWRANNARARRAPRRAPAVRLARRQGASISPRPSGLEADENRLERPSDQAGVGPDGPRVYARHGQQHVWPAAQAGHAPSERLCALGRLKRDHARSS
jgi:hypothetical protein